MSDAERWVGTDVHRMRFCPGDDRRRVTRGDQREGAAGDVDAAGQGGDEPLGVAVEEGLIKQCQPRGWVLGIDFGKGSPTSLEPPSLASGSTSRCWT